MNTYKCRYILIIRHGARDKAFDKGRKEHHLQNKGKGVEIKNDQQIPDMTIAGEPATLNYAGWLSDVLTQKMITIDGVITSPMVCAKETAELFLNVFKIRNLSVGDLSTVEDPLLSPDIFWNDPTATSTFTRKINKMSLSRAIAVVGHQPQLSWIVNKMIDKKQILPLKPSEILCIDFFRRKACWSISIFDKEIIQELKDKIKMKLDVAKFFAGFISILLGIALSRSNDLFDTKNTRFQMHLSIIGSTFILCSLALCIATVYNYDKLLMPSLFWGGGEWDPENNSGLERPPTQTHWILHSNMIRTWNILFVPATFLFFTGLIILFLKISDVRSFYYFCLMIPILIIIPLILYKKSKISLGFDD